MSFLSIITLSLTVHKDRIKTHRHTIKSIGALAGGNLAGSLLSAIGGILVARFVGPETNGQFRLFTIPLMYLTFLHLGTFDGLYRQIPFFVGSGRPDKVEKLASTAGAWNLGVTVVVATGFLFFSFLAIIQGNRVNAVGWFSQSLACVGVFYGCYLGATFRTLNNFVVLARIQLLQAVVGFCMIVAVAYWGFYGLCMRSVIPVLVGVWFYQKTRPLHISLRFDFVTFKEVVRIGLPLSFWGTLYTSLWMAAEYSLMLHFGGVKGVGLFAVAVIIRESLSILPQSVHQVFMPRVVESYAREGGVRPAAKRTFLMTGLLSILMVSMVVIISIMLDYFVPLFIPKYVDGLLLMKVCLGLVVIQAASLPLNGLVATGRSWLYGKGILAGMFVFPLAVYMLNPYIGGILAVAAGSLIGRIVRTIVAYFDLLKVMRLEMR